MNPIKPYRAALDVRVMADETASGMSQGEFADLIYERIVQGKWRWEQAVRGAARVAGCPQWVLVAASGCEHGFGFAYFFVRPGGQVALVLGGVLGSPIELPMPTTRGMTGSVAAQRCGVATLRVAIADTINVLAERAKQSGLLPTPDGWDLDLEMIRVQGEAVAPDAEMVVCETIELGEEG